MPITNTVRRRAGALLLTFGCATTLSCGDDDQPSPDMSTCNADFSTADACAGNPVGTWTLQTACGRLGVLANIESTCSELEVLSESVTSVNGSIVLRSDSTYTESFTITGEVDFTIAATCLPSEVMTCAQLGQRLTESFNEETMAQCTDSPGGCRCSLDAALTRQSSGQYSVDGASFQVGDGLVYAYCAENDTLTLRSFQDSAAVTPTLVFAAEP